MPDSDTIALYLALLGPLLAGIALAYLVELLRHPLRRLIELALPALVVVIGLFLDLRTEGPAHGVLPYLFLSLPGILSFSAWRSLLTRRHATVVR
jgi:hypothetical protein